VGASEPTHHCPGCATPLRLFARYPWYFCQSCLEQARTGEGRPLAFYNTGPGGGFDWRFADEPEGGQPHQDHAGAVCLIKDRRVLVKEARFGGIVAQPMNDVPIDLAQLNIVDLS
jgi:hypothetical protein